LEVLGIRPHKGRGFTHDEEQEGLRSHVVLISHALWRNHFGGTDDALGQQMTLDREDFTVVGVMPPGFTYPYANDLWFPLHLERESEGSWGLNVQARLAEGVTLERARQELEVLARRLRADYPDILGDRTLTPVSTRDVLLGEKGHQSVALLGAVGFVLLIVCINIACLLLARSVARRREMSIRSALGATRARQIRQLLTESGLMAAAGGALGLVLALWLSRSLPILVPGRMSNLLEAVPIDSWVVLFTLALTIVAGMLFGALPSWVATRGGLEALRRGGRGQDGSSSSRLFNWMVIAEVALCLLLLTGAGLMLQNLQGLLSSDLGYDPRHLTVFSVTLGGDEYSHPQRRIQSVRQIEDRLRALPEVAEAGLTSMFPSHRGAVGTSLEIEGKPMEPQDPQILAHSRLVSPGFFAAMNMRARRGRLLQPSDSSEAAPVALISNSLAQAYWPDSSPVGERIRSRRSDDGRWLTIVGIVPDLREYFGIEHAWYRPYAQQADTPASEEVTFVVRTNSAAEALQETLNGAVREADRNLPVFDFTPVPELFRESLDQERLGTVLMGAFAVFGLLIAALGILGVTAYGVNRGRNELGIRLALGARPDQVLLLVVKRTLRLAVWGVVIGIAGSLVAGRLLSGWVVSLSPPGLSVLMAVSLFLLAVALAASYWPARSASKVDPLQALRLE
ncbi:MAG TPA: ABC transporter permease, partial [Acidobacteriota bacterium]|nr:ABC transporter permease [Acidobacteriota bacterium]